VAGPLRFQTKMLDIFEDRGTFYSHSMLVKVCYKLYNNLYNKAERAKRVCYLGDVGGLYKLPCSIDPEGICRGSSILTSIYYVTFLPEALLYYPVFSEHKV
jgi:hypothetical protein